MDAAGMTQAQVEELSLEQQFNLMAERYGHMQELMADAQRVISEEEWQWGSKGLAANGGAGQHWSMPGATGENSYYLNTSRNIKLPGARSERVDTEAIAAYFESQGWETTVRETQLGDLEVKAGTSDGYGFEFVVRPNGQCSLGLYSKVFWGDNYGLTPAVIGRVPIEKLSEEASVPGVYIEFPKWTDPIVTD